MNTEFPFVLAKDCGVIYLVLSVNSNITNANN